MKEATSVLMPGDLGRVMTTARDTSRAVQINMSSLWVRKVELDEGLNISIVQLDTH